MPGARLVPRATRDLLGEGPMWSAREQALYWTDILAHRIHRLSLADGSVESRQFDAFTGWVIERAGGGLVAGVGRSVVALDWASGTTTPLVTLDDDAANRVNDAKADAQGRIWAGIMAIDCATPSGSFHRIDPDGSATRVDAPYAIANGPAIAPDGSFLLHTDTALATIFRFAIHDDGSLGPREPFLVFQPDWGSPDGMTFDAEGNLWVACWGAGEVVRFTPEGRRERRIALPAPQVTSCTFAGDALDRMFVTSAAAGDDSPTGGALFEVDPGCRGLPTHFYRG